MVDTLGMIDGSPSAEQIAAWLDHLGDEELLERMSRLEPTHDYGPELSDFEVLKGMRDEAAASVADEAAGGRTLPTRTSRAIDDDPVVRPPQEPIGEPARLVDAFPPDSPRGCNEVQ